MKHVIAIASDKSGYPLKTAIIEHFSQQDTVELLDFGLAHADENKPYDAQASTVAMAIQTQKAQRGVLICGDRTRHGYCCQ